MSTPVVRRETSAGHPETRDRSVQFGLAVYRKRKALGLSQEQLGEALDWDRTSISRIENAAFSPSLHRLFLLADALGCELADLMRAARDGAS